MATPFVYPAREAVRRSFELLPAAARTRFGIVILIQVLTSFLDLVGVLLLTGVGVLAIAVAQGGTAQLPSILEGPVEQLLDQGWGLKEVTVSLAVASALFFVAKSLFSGYLSRRTLVFLSNRQAQVSTGLIARLLNQTSNDIEQRSTLTTAYAVVQGATAAMVGILGAVATIISETFLLIVFTITLLIINPGVTIVASAYLGFVAFLVYKVLGSWSERVGVVNAETAIRGNTYVQDTLSAFREISVLNRRGIYVGRISELLFRGARAQADSAFMSQLPKYVFEAALIVGAVLLAGTLILTSTMTNAVATMILFLAAGSRVLPSIMRLQGAVVVIRSSSGSAMETYRLADQVRHSPTIEPDGRSHAQIREELGSRFSGFSPSIGIADLSFTYAGEPAPALVDVSLSVAAGSSLALVGATGAGKSTLADLILGVLTPTSGKVHIGDETPVEAITRWPGAIAYVPQIVILVEGSVRENVALGLPPESVSDDQIWEALNKAHIADFLRDQRDGLSTQVGERGLRLSGGQRQRLGIARALLSRPKLLVLDEATSALDAQTEVLISEVMQELHGATTLVVIAHRLATVRSFDVIAYLEAGKLKAAGRFKQVREQVSDFDEQARILGL